jgi:murein L,D-transpeptidase YcbB/YkuD
MERWRWLPRKLGVRYIIVNTAAYNLAAIENEKILFTMWVVIGKEQRQTPVISGNMHTVVFNPYWTVPLKLVFEDLIPKQLNNPDYLKQKNIRVMRNLAKDIDVDPRKLDWQSYTQETFPYVLRQDPGPENPLGRIKFLFSNNFEIYLHDTPKRYLFDKSKRAFSAGCIRIENPLQLATFLLANRSEWQPARIRQALRAKQTFELALKQRTPVYLLYLTSWVGEDNTIYFYEDVYERDKLLLAASR